MHQASPVRMGKQGPKLLVSVPLALPRLEWVRSRELHKKASARASKEAGSCTRRLVLGPQTGLIAGSSVK